MDMDMVVLDADVTTKEEAIKLAVDRLFILGRAENSLALEEAVWQREATYSTGFGRGFAIPHCKSSAVRANSLVLLKPRIPIPWNSLDGLPVRVVILMAIREAQAVTKHMQVFAKLARLMMDRDFCGHLERENSAEKLCAFLQKSLAI